MIVSRTPGKLRRLQCQRINNMDGVQSVVACGEKIVGIQGRGRELFVAKRFNPEVADVKELAYS